MAGVELILEKQSVITDRLITPCDLAENWNYVLHVNHVMKRKEKGEKEKHIDKKGICHH